MRQVLPVVFGIATAIGAATVVADQSASTTQAGSPQAPDIRAFLQVTPEFCTGGQPRLEHFAELKANGVKTVLNLRTPGEHRADEEKQTVEQLGMKYVNIPVVYQSPKMEQVDEFLKITDDPANRPMFVHCTAAIRAGAFWLIRRVVRDKWTWDAALAEARKVGLVNAPHLETFAREYIAKMPGVESIAPVAARRSNWR
jgi:uncharacterized protein (TIGR01244 family)